ncbi:MAG: PEGA domain-containing protein [Myxococcales bacterium]|nr:PEGA domain-containing protein [Myxococcales bacterium]
MAERPRAAWIGLLLWAALSPALAAPPVVVIGIETDGQAAQAIRAGADADQAATRATDAALARAEQAFLDLDYPAAEADLSQAVNDLFGRPERPLDAERAFQATVRLAQVLLASGRKRAAGRLLTQAHRTWPGFPGRLTPAPDVAELLAQVAREQRGAGALVIRSQPSGRLVRVNGVAVGTTPVELPGYGDRSARVCIDGPAGPRCASAAGGQVTVVADAPAERARLADSVVRGDEAEGWQALAGLQATLGVGAACVVAVHTGHVVVARLDGTARAVSGGDRMARPSGSAGWRAVGQHCREGVGGASAEVLRAALWGGAPVADSGLSGRHIWGWSAAGAGVASAALGVGFGLSAQDAAAAYRSDGRVEDKDRAVAHAVVADVAYVGAALLLGTGIYLLLFD